jgi:anti-anti-sigma factor
MALTMTETENQGVTILKLVGRLTMGPEDITFKTILDRCISCGKLRIILDCSRLEDIDSLGIGDFIGYQEKLHHLAGRLVLLKLSQRHMKLFMAFELDSALEMFTNLEDTIDSFFPDRDVKRYDILHFVEQQEGRK